MKVNEVAYGKERRSPWSIRTPTPTTR